MRNDNHDEIDLSQHRASRLPGLLVIAAALCVALIAAWVFTPILMSKDSAATAGLFNRTKAPPAAQNQPAAPAPTLASAQSTPVAPTAQPDAATDDQTATASLGPAVASAGPSAPWPQDRGIQVAAATPDSTPEPAAEPAVMPVEPFDNVPLPRKRPSRLIAASLAIPLPRPRPEIEPDAPAGPSAFDLQVERMR